MKYKWINNSENNKLIIFFNGWGMDENVISHLDFEDFDIIMFYDYNTLDTDFNFSIINKYSEKNVVAWSMGVFISYIILNSLKINFTKKIAINGTLAPINENFGIHPKIYNLTIQGFNANGQKKFINSMFSEENSFSIDSLTRDLENQKTELISIKEFASSFCNFQKDFFNKIIISSNDKIFPTKSQTKFWQKDATINSGHCPFYIFSKWSELI